MNRFKAFKWRLVIIETERFDCKSSIISILTTQKLIHKGTKAFLAYILDTQASKLKIDQIPIVQEFVDVFLEKLSDLR